MTFARSFLAVSVLVLGAASGLAQDKVKITPTVKVDDTIVHKVTAKFEVQGMGVEITGTRMIKVTKVDDKVVTASLNVEDMKVLVGGGEQGINAVSGDVEMKPDGNVQRITGGIEGSDFYRLFATTHFVAPTVELAPGDKYTVEFDEVKAAEIPKRKVEGTYVGKEDFKGKPALKFTVKYSEPGVTGGMSLETTYWVDETGKVLKLTGKITSMFVPAVGTYVDGTIEAEIQP